MPPPSKRRKTNQVEEITFDPTARQEYLTGFHKRKLQRKENAREAALKREKEDRVRERRQLREQRKEDLERHVAQVNAELRKQNPDLSSEDENEDVEVGVQDDPVRLNGDASKVPQEEEEFVDEDKYTTVTVEPMDGHGKVAGLDSDDEDGDTPATTKMHRASGESKVLKKKSWTKDDNRAAKKKRAFRYESKGERAATRQKQKSKSHAAKMRRKGD